MKINNINSMNFGHLIKIKSNKIKHINETLKRNPANSPFSLSEKPDVTYIFTGHDAETFLNSHNEAWDEMDFWFMHYNCDAELASDMADASWEKHYDRMANYIKNAEKNGDVIDYTI